MKTTHLTTTSAVDYLDKLNAQLELAITLIPHMHDFINLCKMYGGFLRFLVEDLTSDYSGTARPSTNLYERFLKYNTDIDMSTQAENREIVSLFRMLKAHDCIIEYYGVRYNRTLGEPLIEQMLIDLESPDVVIPRGNYAIFVPTQTSIRDYFKYDLSVMPHKACDDFTANMLVARMHVDTAHADKVLNTVSMQTGVQARVQALNIPTKSKSTKGYTTVANKKKERRERKARVEALSTELLSTELLSTELLSADAPIVDASTYIPKHKFQCELSSRHLCAISDIVNRKIRWIYNNDDPKLLYRYKKLHKRGYTVDDDMMLCEMFLENQKYCSKMGRRARREIVDTFQYAYDINSPTVGCYVENGNVRVYISDEVCKYVCASHSYCRYSCEHYRNVNCECKYDPSDCVGECISASAARIITTTRAAPRLITLQTVLDEIDVFSSEAFKRDCAESIQFQNVMHKREMYNGVDSSRIIDQSRCVYLLGFTSYEHAKKWNDGVGSRVILSVDAANSKITGIYDFPLAPSNVRSAWVFDSDSPSHYRELTVGDVIKLVWADFKISHSLAWSWY